MTYRILTVCTGNICRSPMAETMIREAGEKAGLDVLVDSAGTTGWETDNPMDPRAITTLNEHGSTPEPHRARQISTADFRDADLILALDTDHYQALLEEAPDQSSQEKVRMLRSFDPEVAHEKLKRQGIADPWYGDQEDFETTWELIDAALPGLMEHVRNSVAR